MELGEVARQVFAGRPVARLKPSDSTRSARVLGLRDVTRHLAPLSDLEAADAPDTEETDRLALEPGDVVITSRGSTIRAAVAGQDHAGVIVGANLIVVRLEPVLSPHLLAAYLRHPAIQRRLLADFVGSTTAGFTVESLRGLPIEIYASEDQQLLARLVEAVEAYADHVLAGAELRRQAALEVVFERLAPNSMRS
jgi:type I restriction enzyme M protein